MDIPLRNLFYTTIGQAWWPARSLYLYLVVTGFCLLFGQQVHSGEPTFDYGAWDSVLERFVDENGRVDYQGLSNQRGELDQFLALVHTVGPSSRPALFPGRNHELAYYINAYNALVFEGVLSRGPEKTSVWRGLVSGLNFFVRMDVMLDGATTNLRKLENDIIRDRYLDPRIHAALNCASNSCPRLPRHSFRAETLDEQLDDAMAEFVSSRANVRVDAPNRTVHISEIFDWFEEDFIRYEERAGNSDPGLLAYINRYRASNQQIPARYKIRFIPYDKGINSQ